MGPGLVEATRQQLPQIKDLFQMAAIFTLPRSNMPKWSARLLRCRLPERSAQISITYCLSKANASRLYKGSLKSAW